MEILELILSYVSIWAPSLVAIAGVITTILVALKKCKDAFDNLNKDEALKNVNKKLTCLTAEQEELIKCEKLLLDQLTRIKDFADNTKEV